MKQEEDQSPSIDYIVVAMRNSLDDQTAHAKVCLSYHNEKQKLLMPKFAEVIAMRNKN